MYMSPGEPSSAAGGPGPWNSLKPIVLPLILKDLSRHVTPLAPWLRLKTEPSIAFQDQEFRSISVSMASLELGR